MSEECTTAGSDLPGFDECIECDSTGCYVGLLNFRLRFQVVLSSEESKSVGSSEKDVCCRCFG